LPARSEPVSARVLDPAVVVSAGADTLAAAAPDSSSATAAVTVLPVPPTPKLGAGDGQVSVGGVASRLTVIDCDDSPPALDAVQVSVCDAVSAVIAVASHPGLLRRIDSSVTFQVTWPPASSHPFWPWPLTAGVIEGGVLSGYSVPSQNLTSSTAPLTSPLIEGCPPTM
jgi:hypothetical protein